MVLPFSSLDAAFPVGATQLIFGTGNFRFSAYDKNNCLILVVTLVLPVPGPPEMMVK